MRFITGFVLAIPILCLPHVEQELFRPSVSSRFMVGFVLLSFQFSKQCFVHLFVLLSFYELYHSVLIFSSICKFWNMSPWDLSPFLHLRQSVFLTSICATNNIMITPQLNISVRPIIQVRSINDSYVLYYLN